MTNQNEEHQRTNLSKVLPEGQRGCHHPPPYRMHMDFYPDENMTCVRCKLKMRLSEWDKLWKERREKP